MLALSVMARREWEPKAFTYPFLFKCISLNVCFSQMTGTTEVHHIKKLWYQFHSLKYRTSTCLDFYNLVPQNIQTWRLLKTLWTTTISFMVTYFLSYFRKESIKMYLISPKFEDIIIPKWKRFLNNKRMLWAVEIVVSQLNIFHQVLQ